MRGAPYVREAAVAAPRVGIAGLAQDHGLRAPLCRPRHQVAAHPVRDARPVGRPGGVARGLLRVERGRGHAPRRVQQEQARRHAAPARGRDHARPVRRQVEVVPGPRLPEARDPAPRAVHEDELARGVLPAPEGERAGRGDRRRHEAPARVVVHLRRQDARVADGSADPGDRQQLEPAVASGHEVAVGEPDQHGALQHDARGRRRVRSATWTTGRFLAPSRISEVNAEAPPSGRKRGEPCQERGPSPAGATGTGTPPAAFTWRMAPSIETRMTPSRLQSRPAAARRRCRDHPQAPVARPPPRPGPRGARPAAPVRRPEEPSRSVRAREEPCLDARERADEDAVLRRGTPG